MSSELTCTKCGLVGLPDEDFPKYKGKKNGYSSNCRPCHRESVRAYKKKNAHKNSKWKRRNMIRQYGIEPEDYDSLLVQQNGKCAICEKPPGRGSLQIDHCHSTGMVRGLLCGPCNRMLGMASDDPDILIAASKYLHNGVK